MKKFSQWFFALLFFFAAVVYVFPFKKDVKVENVQNVNYVKIGNTELKVEIVSTNEKRAKGLSGRKELKENEGMLFVFDKLAKNYFWMKEMNFPLDIIWFDQNKKIIYLEKNVLPSSYPKSFGSDFDSQYVLEVSAFFSDRNNLKIGDFISFLP